MKLAESGLPKGGGVGYEIFDKSDALGATTFIQNINHLRALEGELARTIRSLDRVQAARVHLVLPDRPLFSRDKIEPSASIVLKVRGTLEPQQVRAIRHLVATRGQRHEARTRFGDRRDRQAARRRRRDRPTRWSGAGADERKAALRKAPARPGRDDRLLGGRPRPRARARSPPISTSTASPRPPTNSIPTAAWCARARRARNSSSTGDNKGGPVSVGNELPGAGKPPADGGHQRPEPQDRGNRQLRNLAHHQDRGDRGRPRQPHFRGRAGRRHLHQERQGRGHLSAALEGRDRPHRRAGALGHRLRCQARRPGRSGQSALRRDARRCRSTSRPAG